MRILVDGMGAAPGTSAHVILEHLLRGWSELGQDDLHVLLDPRLRSRIVLPEGVTDEPVSFGSATAISRVKAQTLLVPRLCRRLGVDALVGLLPSTSIAPLPCPRVVISLDLRYELLPRQFTFRTRFVRKVAYGIGFRQADAIACVSERTRRDLMGPRPWLAGRRVGLAPLGSDHVAGWPKVPTDEPYAVAFGQYGNKNVDMVIDAWAVLRDRGHAMPLKLIGMPDSARAQADAHIARLGLEETVTPMGWLFGEDLQRCFASAGLFVFPSDFEGFGMPAVEAMRLGIPLVVSPEPALLEVTAGTATVMDGWGPEPLADAVERARAATPAGLDAARRRAEEFTWAGMATAIRDLVVASLPARQAS